MITGIYRILNKVTGKFYIGSALNVRDRWRRHKRYLNLNEHQNTHLQRAWNKHNEINFEFTVLCECNKDDLLKLEQSWLNWTKCFNFDIGYNLTPTAGNSLGVRHSEETRSRMSEAKRKMTNETKLKMSLTRTGRKHSEQHKANISAGLTGKKRGKYKLTLTAPPLINY